MHAVFSASALLTVLLLAQPQEEMRPATVAGRVVDASTGRPVPGVVVTAAGSAVRSGPTTPAAPRALTNGQGEFVLRGLAKGTLYFTAAKSGYANATYNQRRPGGSGQGLPIENGATVNGAEIRIWRHASITGTVVDEAGEPAVGVRVRAYQRSFVAGRKRFAAAASGATDDRGVYRIANLTPGDYAVGIASKQNAIPTEAMDVFFARGGGGTDEQRRRVSRELNELDSAIVPAGSQYAIAVGDQTFTLSPGTLAPQFDANGRISIYPSVFYPAAGSVGQATVLTIKSGEERGSVDVQMRPARATRVSGTIVGPEGPASNVGVRLVPAGSDAADATDVATTLTNTAGNFTFPAVPPGQFVLKVLRPPREPIGEVQRISVTPGGEITMGTTVPRASTGPPPPLAIPADATLYAQIPLATGDSDSSGLIVTLAAGSRVAGRVEFEGTADKPTGAALTGIRINLDPADGSRLDESMLAFQVGRPEEDGSFRTFGVPPGKYVLRVNTPQGWHLKGAFAGGTDVSDVPFDLGARDLANVVITFTDRPSSLTGSVRDGTNADADAVVLAFPVDATAWAARGAFPRRMKTARTERDGTYTITGLPPGEYHVIAVHEESFADWQDPALLDALARVARQIRVLEGERRTLDLTAAVIR
jgi:protocatechuate 3,4-dioxygenase beta subunit